MKIINKKWLIGCSSIIAICAVTLSVWGCSKNTKPEIEVALWNLDVYDHYTEQVQSLVPDVKIKWVEGQRNLDYYKQLAETESLPDIIMRCDSDSGKKLIKSVVLRTADRQGMC